MTVQEIIQQRVAELLGNEIIRRVAAEVEAESLRAAAARGGQSQRKGPAGVDTAPPA